MMFCGIDMVITLSLGILVGFSIGFLSGISKAIDMEENDE